MRTYIGTAALTCLLLTACSHTTPRTSWQPYSFNGSQFVAGDFAGMPTILVRSGFVPARDSSGRGGALATTDGAVAGFCYRQTSGGKMSTNPGNTALAVETIYIFRDRKSLQTTQSDSAGFFAESLPAGNYEIACRGIRIPFRIRQGETTLVPLPCGKRMVD